MPKVRDPKLNKNGAHVYLASSFFNARQLAIVDMLAKVVPEKTKLPVFSPKDQGGVLGPKADLKARQDVVASNRKGIAQSLFVLAVLDYAMMDEQELRVVRPTTMTSGKPHPTRRGDVLYDWTYTGAEDVPPAAPGWMLAQWEAHDEDDRLPLAFDCSTLDGARGDAHWSTFRPPGDVPWPITLHAEDIGLYRVQCIAI